jgi:uncharacterized protein
MTRTARRFVLFAVLSILLGATTLGDVTLMFGSGEMCFRRGQAYESRNPDRAASLFRTACRRGYAAGCVEAAEAYVRGEGVPRDDAAAQRWFERGCDLGSGRGCHRLVELLRSGSDAETAAPRLADLLRRAEAGYANGCAKDTQSDCFSLGLMLSRRKDAPARGPEAVAALSRACELGSWIACSLEARERRRGRLVPPDTRAALRLDEKLCREQRSEAHCCTAGVAYAAGDGVPANPDVAQAFFQDACEGGDVHACMAAWERSARTAPGLRRAAADVVGSCGSATYPPGGCFDRCSADPSAVRGLAKAHQRFLRLCRDGDPVACHAGGLMFMKAVGTPVDEAQGLALLTAACDADLAMACLAIAVHDPFGYDAADEPRVRALIEKACRGGSSRACAVLAPRE